MFDIELSCIEFADKLSSKAPTPGGGGAAAYAGALSSALCSMVANLTIGKKKYADVEEDIKKLLNRTEVYRHELMELVGRDAEAFEPLSKAYSLPKDTYEAKAHRDEVMETCLNEASKVPMHIMEVCCKVIALIDELAKKGSVLAVSDAACAASLAKSALQCAHLNVLINTKSMKDRGKALRINEYCDDMLEYYEKEADKVYNEIKERLKIA